MSTSTGPHYILQTLAYLSGFACFVIACILLLRQALHLSSPEKYPDKHLKKAMKYLGAAFAGIIAGMIFGHLGI